MCSASLKMDHSGSTKIFHKDLMKRHNLVDPKVNKKIQKTQEDIARYLKKVELVPKACTSNHPKSFLF